LLAKIAIGCDLVRDRSTGHDILAVAIALEHSRVSEALEEDRPIAKKSKDE
jgi:hypothetical protein